MKQTAVLLALVAQTLAAAVGEPTLSDYFVTRTFSFPGFPGGPFPTRWPEKREAAPEPEPEPAGFDSSIVLGAPDPSQVQMEGVAYGGTGCPSNSVSSVLSDDRTIMTLIFDQYVASIGPGTPVTENRKNCQLNIDLRYPGGFQYSIFSADYRGYAYLDKGVTGTQKSTYYFSGQTDQTSTQTNWVGPYDSDYLVHDTADSTSIVWSPCGSNAALNINSQLRLTSTNASAVGELTNDSIDASFKQIVHVSWQACNQTSTS